MDKRTTKATQLNLELISKEDYRPIIKQHFNTTFARQGKTGVFAKRIFNLCLAKMDENSPKLEPVYIPIKDIVTKSELDEHYGGSIINLAKTGLTELGALSMWVVNKKGNLEFNHFIESGSEIIPSTGVMRIILNHRIKDYYKQLKHYTIFELDMFMRVKSWYSQRFIEVLSTFRDNGFWLVSIDKYRDVMGTNYYNAKGKLIKQLYSKVKDLIQRTTKEPLEELKGTYLEIGKIEKIYDKTKTGKGRKPITHLKFYLQQKQIKKIPDAWRTNEYTKDIIEKMETYKIDEPKIVRFCLGLGRGQVKEVIDRIDKVKRESGIYDIK
ncbi:MAG: replication initiation protein, partial [Bacteroidota bacterium]